MQHHDHLTPPGGPELGAQSAGRSPRARRRGAGVLLALAASVSLGLAACGGGANAAPAGGGSSASGEPVRGGTLVFAEVTPIKAWQTQNARFYEKANVLNSVLDRLTWFDKDSKELKGWIAKDFEASKDQKTFTFTIRPGVSFSDGTPLDAAAVKANLDALGQGIPSAQIQPNVDFSAYASSAVQGDKVVVSLKRPDANFLRATSSVAAGLVSPATLKGDNAAQSDISKIVGSGPFVFASQVPDQSVKFTARKDYAWAPEGTPNQGAAYLDGFEVRYLPEVGNRAGAVQTGQVDLARGLQPVDEDAVRGAGHQVLPAAGLDLTANAAAIRVGSGTLADATVRRALSKGIDRKAIKDTVLSESYTVADSILNHGAPGFVDLSKDLAFDPQGAERELDAAGWVKGSDGTRSKDGKPLEVTVTSSNNSVVIKPAFELIEQQWAAIGVKLVNRAGDNTFLATALNDPNVEIFGTRQFAYGGLGPVFGPKTNTQTLHDDAARDTLFAQEQAATDKAKHAELVGQEQRRIVVEDAVALPLWDEVQVYGAHAGVHVDFTSGTAPVLQSAWKESK